MFLQVHATRQAFMSDLDRPVGGVRDMKRQCRGLGMAGRAYVSLFSFIFKAKNYFSIYFTVIYKNVYNMCILLTFSINPRANWVSD